jgi:hypothetical protein
VAESLLSAQTNRPLSGRHNYSLSTSVI